MNELGSGLVLRPPDEDPGLPGTFLSAENPVEAAQISDLQNCEVISGHCFQPLNVG